MKTDTLEVLPLITLVGPPNSGKTTLFNSLSGSNFKTVNYPGATVEYSISRALEKFNLKVNLLDSPGIVSLLPSSPDEEVSINALYSYPKLGVPDLVIATIDASQLSRHLFLVRQLIDSNFNVIVAVTMIDILNKKGFDISIPLLSELLHCEIIPVDGRNGKGTSKLMSAAEKNLKKINLHEKKQPVRFSKHLSKTQLLNYYKNIEQIEQKVIYEIKSSKERIDVKTANSQLQILTNPAVKKSCNKIDETTLRIDKFLLHNVWGLISFFLIMSLTFTSIFWLAEPIMNLVDTSFSFLSFTAKNILGNNWLSDLVANGILAGTGSVLVFVPQILILFLILGILEDSGYLARGAMLIDKPLSKIGLNGKSFVPMLSGFACAIPAMMAARTIPNRRERFLTIFIIPLISCSARLPVYALLIAFLFPGNKSWMGGILLAAIYILSIFSSISIAGIVNKLRNKLIKTEDNSSFILELPAYRRPKLKVVVINTYHSTKLYIKKAGPIILGFSIVLWFLTYFPNHTPHISSANLTHEEIIQKENAERLSGSYAADLGKIIQPVMTPLGMDWRVGVSLISAFAAREVFVSSLALIFKVTGDEHNIQNSMVDAMRKAEIGNTGQKLFTPATILGLIVFFIFAMQCISTLAVSMKETGGWRIPILQLIIFTSLAYILTFITVNGLRAIGIS